MKIEIPDDTDPKERKRLLKILPIRYALKKFGGYNSQAAKWLGITSKTLRSAIEGDQESYKIARHCFVYDDIKERIREALESGVDIKSSKFYRYASGKNKKIFDRFIEELKSD